MTDFDPSTVKLGKKLGVVEDRRTFKMGAFLAPIETPPAHASVAHTIKTFPMFKNDAIGDCGVASFGHSVIARERSAQQDFRKIDLTDDQIVTAYSAISGYDPKTGRNDNGIYLIDGANYYRKVGVGQDENGEPHKILAYAKVDHLDHSEVKRALWMFGGLWIGAGLPQIAAQQIQDGQPWDVVALYNDDTKWGSWGGHAMYVPAYDVHGLEAITWGQRQKMTWAWWDMYVDEAYAMITHDFLRQSHDRTSEKTPQGFDLNALQNALEQLH